MHLGRCSYWPTGSFCPSSKTRLATAKPGREVVSAGSNVPAILRHHNGVSGPTQQTPLALARATQGVIGVGPTSTIRLENQLVDRAFDLSSFTVDGESHGVLIIG